MKIRTITYSQTRQIKDYHPANFSLSCDITDDEDAMEAGRALQELTIRILYKDRPIERDSLIKQLCHSDAKSEIKKPAKQEPEDDSFPDFAP